MGCVNTVNWSDNGDFLVSGSDDTQGIQWSNLAHPAINSYTLTYPPTLHPKDSRPHSHLQLFIPCVLLYPDGTLWLLSPSLPPYNLCFWVLGVSVWRKLVHGCSVCIWKYADRRLSHTINTGHQANIFCSKFAPGSVNLVMSCSGDSEVVLCFSLDPFYLLLVPSTQRNIGSHSQSWKGRHKSSCI